MSAEKHPETKDEAIEAIGAETEWQVPEFDPGAKSSSPPVHASSIGKSCGAATAKIKSSRSAADKKWIPTLRLFLRMVGHIHHCQKACIGLTKGENAHFSAQVQVAASESALTPD
jgi:hypothetical protein